jgi:hypothetical protein
MAHEIDGRIQSVLEALEAALPMKEFGVTIVVMDQREGKADEISVYGNRLGHGKYHILEHALEQEERMPPSPETPEIAALNAKARGRIH